MFKKYFSCNFQKLEKYSLTLGKFYLSKTFQNTLFNVNFDPRRFFSFLIIGSLKHRHNKRDQLKTIIIINYTVSPKWKLTSWLFYTMDDTNELTDTENNLWQMFHLYMTMIQNTELFKRISIETDLAKFSIFLIFDPKKLFTLGFTGNLCIWIRSPRWFTKKNYYCW